MGNGKNKLKKSKRKTKKIFKKGKQKKYFLVFDYPLIENAQTKVIFVVHKIDVDK